MARMGLEQPHALCPGLERGKSYARVGAGQVGVGRVGDRASSRGTDTIKQGRCYSAQALAGGGRKGSKGQE